MSCLAVRFLFFMNLIYEIQTGGGKQRYVFSFILLFSVKNGIFFIHNSKFYESYMFSLPDYIYNAVLPVQLHFYFNISLIFSHFLYID